AAGAETDIFGLQERLRENEIGRRMRFPGRGVVLADPGFLVAEFIEPSQRLQVPVVTLFQPALRRMGRHREISDLHGVSSRCSFFQSASIARKREHSTRRVWLRYDETDGLKFARRSGALPCPERRRAEQRLLRRGL